MSARYRHVCMLFVAAALLGLPRTALAVDGVILIDQNRVMAGNITPGDAAGFPVTISRTGSYRLSSNLDVPPNAVGVLITAPFVTLDLNGFALRTTDGFGAGIFANTGADHLAVTNGVVTGFGGTAVFLQGSGNRAENLQVIANGAGLVAGPGSLVRGNIARLNDSGIEVRGGGVVVNNVATDNTNFGIIAAGSAGVVGGNTLINNTASSNGNVGIQVVCPSTLIGNTAVNNASQNIRLITTAGPCTTEHNTAP